MTDGDDLYALLGVPRSATTADITDAYAASGPAGDPDARDDAYDVLRDPARRRAYDDLRTSRSDAADAARTSEHHAPSGDGDVELHLSFDQAALGTTATLHVAANSPCEPCAGTGTTPGPACETCGGAGFHARTSGGISIRTECRACDGAGRAPDARCIRCSGAGTITATRAVTIRVPAGVTDGARLRFHLPDDRDRQRYAVVRVAPHAYFTRSGNDLTVTVPITIAEAALGATVSVPTLRDAVAIRVPPGTPTGRTFRVRDRGIPSTTGAGDLLATIHVVLPSDLNDDQRRALETFAAATPSPRQHFTTTTTNQEPQEND